MRCECEFGGFYALRSEREVWAGEGVGEGNRGRRCCCARRLAILITLALQLQRVREGFLMSSYKVGEILHATLVLAEGHSSHGEHYRSLMNCETTCLYEHLPILRVHRNAEIL